MKRRLISKIWGLIRALSIHENWRSYTRMGDEKLIRAKFPRGEKWHADFCADPFLFHHEGNNYLFYETTDKSGKGMIGVFKLVGGRWKNLGKALEEEFHLSYPQVFKMEDGKIYMIPESSDKGKGAVYLYEAEEFPLKWRRKATLIDRPFADATLLKEGGHWYMACYTIPPHETAELWEAPTMEGPWRRHPMWNKINQSARLRRCGGRFIRRNGKLFRMAQDCNGSYGKRLFVVEVKAISPEVYEEGEAKVFYDRRKPPHKQVHTYNEMETEGGTMSVIDAHGFVRMPWDLMASFAGYAWERVRRLIKR